MTYLSKIAITIVLGATMALTACALPVGGNMNAQIATPTLPTDYPTELPTNYPTELPTELSTSIAATPTTTSAEPKPVEIPLTNIIFDDPETQDHIEVLSIIRNFPSDARGTGRETVLLQVKVIPGEVYTEAYSAAGGMGFGWWLVEHYLPYHINRPDGCGLGEPTRGRKYPPYFQMSYGPFDNIADLVDPFVESPLPV